MTPSAGPWRRAPLAAAALLAALQVALLVDTARKASDTVDEDTYLAAAGVLWAHRDFGQNPESPVLPKWAFAWAMHLVDPGLAVTPKGVTPATEHVLWYGTRARTERVLFAARLTTIAVTALGGLFLWATALRAGVLAALVAHLMWCFSPTVLAAGSLATLDAWVASLVALLMWATVRCVERPGTGRAALVGLASGAALAAKVTAGGAVLVAMAAVAVAAWRRSQEARPRARALGLLLAIVLVSGLTLWAVYGFTVGRVAAPEGLGAAAESAEGPASSAPTWGPLPFPAWIEGLLEQLSHASRGHRSYLFGKTSASGWWWFYAANLALKTTLGAQALALLLIAARLRARGTREPWIIDVGLLAYPLLLTAVMSAGRTQLGIRYLLPAFPPTLLWAGRAFPALLERGRRWTLAGSAALVAAVAGALSVHPHYLMFFNAWAGGPEGGPRYLIVGDDIGQDQKRLADWQAAQGLDWIYYTWYSGNPRHWGVEYADPPCAPQRGVYALEAVEVHRPRRIAPGCLDWLTVEPPDERIGYTIYIYRVDKDRVQRLRAGPGEGRVFWRSGRIGTPLGQYTPATVQRPVSSG